MPGRARSPGRWSPRAVYLPGGDPGELAAVRDGRAAVQDEGSQLVALALAAAEGSGLDDDRSGRGTGRQGGAAGGAGSRRHRAGVARDPGPPGRAVGSARGGGRRPVARRFATARPIASCWTRRARDWERCAGGPRRAGGGPPTTSSRSPCCRRRCCAARSGWCGRAGSWRMPPARRIRARPPACSGACSPTRRWASEPVDVRPLLPAGMPRPRSGPDRPALAAPPRHRRHVPGPAAPRLTSVFAALFGSRRRVSCRWWSVAFRYESGVRVACPALRRLRSLPTL